MYCDMQYILDGMQRLIMLGGHSVPCRLAKLSSQSMCSWIGLRWMAVSESLLKDAGDFFIGQHDRVGLHAAAAAFGDDAWKVGVGETACR